MTISKKVLIVGDISYKPTKMFIDQFHKLAKGLMRLGHDARFFNYGNALLRMSPLKSRKFAGKFYKKKVDELLAMQVRNYKPDIIHIGFAQYLNGETIDKIRNEAPAAVIMGGDGDPWPKLQKDRIETAKKLDILITTNDGQFLQDYRDAGVPLCVFMPNMCDPDTDHRYDVSDQWQTDILWTGKAKHQAYSGETLREELVFKLSQHKNCAIYGCNNRPEIGGIDYLYAISGARIGVNVNAINSIRLYHSDRITFYLAGGTLVLAKRVPDTDLLFKDGEHLRYFDTVEEFFDLARWYLEHEKERKRLADAGMQLIHEQFNCVKIAGYLLELIEKDSYRAPWFK